MTPALELDHLTKRFGAVLACDDVSLQVARGEVLAVVGENGAGKTTLMNLAFGLYRPARGEVRVRGRKLAPGSPRDAIAAGLGMVHQHFMLVPPLTVAENVVLGAEPRRRGLLDRRAAEAAVEEMARRYGLALEPRARVASLSVAAQQRVAIVRALHRGAEVLILDEPTALLAPAEAEALLEAARALARGGKSVLLVSHKLREVLSVADRIAVMRRGRLLAERTALQTSAEELARMMIGAEIPFTPSVGAAPLDSAPLREATLGVSGTRARSRGATPTPTGSSFPSPPTGERARVRGPGPVTAPHPDPLPASGEREKGAIPTPKPLVSLRSASALSDRGVTAFQDVDLDVFPGEILAVAGVDGNGQPELADVIAGLRPLSAGEVAREASVAQRAALAFVPADGRLALCPGLSAEENLSLGRHRAPPFARGGRIDRAGRHGAALRLIRELGVQPPEPRGAVATLSGGNQQRLLLA